MRGCGQFCLQAAVATISSRAEFERKHLSLDCCRAGDSNRNGNGLWHCHSAIVQKLVAPLLHNSWTTVLFDCIIPVGGPCNAHITRVCTLLISIDCRRASSRIHFRIVPDLYQHPCGFRKSHVPLFMLHASKSSRAPRVCSKCWPT